MTEKQYEVIVTPFAESALQGYNDYFRHELFTDDQTVDEWLDHMEQEIK